MKGRTTAALFFVLALVLIGGSAKAASYINCNGCNSYQMNNAALANGVGRILVGNLQGDDLEAFRIYYAPQPRSVGGVGASLKVNKYAELDSPTSSEVNAFSAYRALYVAAGGSYVRVVANISLSKSSVGADRARYIELAKPGAQSNQVSVDGNIDAFDVVSTPVYRDQVASKINGIAINGFKNIPNSLQLAIVRVLNYAGIGKIISSPITITVTVQFQDLSQSDFHWDSVSGGWVYTPGSSKDSSGNPIPENEAAASGMPTSSAQKYVFPGNVYGMLDGFNQIENLNRLGIPINKPTVKSGYSWIVACTFLDGHSHCVAQPQ